MVTGQSEAEVRGRPPSTQRREGLLNCSEKHALVSKAGGELERD